MGLNNGDFHMHRLVRTVTALTVIAGTVSWLLFSPALPSVDSHLAQFASGVVYHDANGNRQFDEGEQPLAGVRVSNGQAVVRTDEQGRYRLPVTDDTIIFVVKPRSWRNPLSEDQLPRFYYIHKPGGSPKQHFPGVAPTGPLPASIDFPLYPTTEPDQFRAVLFGDTQPRNQDEIDYMAHDVIEELIGTDASFGVTLGDILFDDLSLYDSQNRTIALLGIPWYNVIGNHDLNRDADHDHYSDETYESYFGPSYYSFDHGPVHFIVLDDVEWMIVSQEKGKTKKKYRGGLGERQMEFIRNDLELTDPEQLVVLLMHIPLIDVHDRHELFRLIERRPFCLSISGHTHFHQHRFLTKADGWEGPEPHHHIINVTVCGSWWRGKPDAFGIPDATMTDGASNGYSIISFDGHDYRLDYKAARRSADYQMNIIAPEAIAPADVEATDVYVNVFNGSERSTVEMRWNETGDWSPLTKVNEPDPVYQRNYEADLQIKEKDWLPMARPSVCGHLWKAKLPPLDAAGTHLLEVRTTDRHGRVYTDSRVIRVVD